MNFQFGSKYSLLLNSKLILPNYLVSGKTRRISLNGKYSNQLNFFVGAGLFLQKNVSLNFKYYLPLKSNEFTDFQISLEIKLHKEYFKRNDSVNNMDLNGIEYEFINANYIEKDGIIYPSTVSTPPVFRDGQASLYIYFENNVRVYTRDFGKKQMAFLFKISMDSLGNVTSANFAGDLSSGHGTGFQNGILPEEIRKIIETMPAWKPALSDGKPDEITFYLPVCFKIDWNKIVMLPSKYQFIFHNRNN
jgi:hypothetical protein